MIKGDVHEQILAAFSNQIEAMTALQVIARKLSQKSTLWKKAGWAALALGVISLWQPSRQIDHSEGRRPPVPFSSNPALDQSPQPVYGMPITGDQFLQGRFQ